LASSEHRVVIARIGAAHGIRGEVRVKTFTEDPASIAAYGPLDTADGRRFEVAAMRPLGGSPDMLVVRLKGIADRNAAEALNGIELSIPRHRLPPAGDVDDFYHADLIGLAAVTPAGEPLGTVVGVPNYGAGDLLEVAPAGGTSVLYPFTRAVVPLVDLRGGRVVVVPPAETADIEGEPGPGAGEELEP